MIIVNVSNGQVVVTMNGTDYRFSNEVSQNIFMEEFYNLSDINKMFDLVCRFLNMLERIAVRIVKKVVRLARLLADADNYFRGVGAATPADVARYL